MSKRQYYEIFDKNNDLYKLKNKVDLNVIELSKEELIQFDKNTFNILSIDQYFYNRFQKDDIFDHIKIKD